MKQKSNFHTLCLLLCQRFAFTEKQSEKKANEVIQLGINQFKTENKDIKLNLNERKYLIDSLISLVVDRLNKEQMDSFNELQIYIYTRDFEQMTEAVLGSINQRQKLETIPPAKTESKRSEAQKRAYLKYIHSVKGQEALKRYRQSAKGKLTIGKAVKKYQQTALGKEAVKRAYLKYSQSDRGREKRREAVRAYRQKQRDKSILATGGTN